MAGNPTANVKDFELDDPEWKGLDDIEVTRAKSAAEQLIHLKHRQTQQPIRDYAILLVLLHTALRVSELLALDLKQYRGKHLRAVARKGRKVTDKVFLPKAARQALDRYLSESRGTKPGPLLCSKSGNRLARQNVDAALKAIANQANANLPDDQRIHLAAHLLRHTNLRKTANEYGVQYAKEQSGHASDRYIWRYVQPSDEEQEQAQEDLL